MMMNQLLAIKFMQRRMGSDRNNFIKMRVKIGGIRYDLNVLYS